MMIDKSETKKQYKILHVKYQHLLLFQFESYFYVERIKLLITINTT